MTEKEREMTTASIKDSAWDSALLHLSRRFSDQSMVKTLGLQVLKLPEHQVDSIWNKHKPDANLAAHDLLKKFAVKYERRQEAFRDLGGRLRNNKMAYFARLFKDWVEGLGDQSDLTQESTYNIHTL